MKIIRNNKSYTDLMQPGAFIGAVFTACGIEKSLIIYHGYLGCHIESIHMRSDTIPGGIYTPVIATGLTQSDSIYGGTDKLKKTLEMVSSGSYHYIWILTGDATSITADDIYSVVNTVNFAPETKVIPLDLPGFAGGISVGTDLSIAALLSDIAFSTKKTDSVALIAPHLMGIKSHPADTDELLSMLEASNINVSGILSKKLSSNSLLSLLKSKYFLPLTWENLPETELICKKFNIDFIKDTLPLPLGIANTEEWLLSTAKLFGNEAQAMDYMSNEKDIVLNQLKYNYNFSWLSTLYADKTCSIYGGSQFAVSLAECFFYDLNIKPLVISILAETKQAEEKSLERLSKLAEFTDFTVLINPDYFDYAACIKDANVDFAVGSVQDKPLCVGEGIPHLNLGGYYFFNNFNFIPWPYMGVKGVLSILTELGFLMEKVFYNETNWQNLNLKANSLKH